MPVIVVDAGRLGKSSLATNTGLFARRATP
jgi:hypothetical protein